MEQKQVTPVISLNGNGFKKRDRLIELTRILLATIHYTA